MMDLAVKLGLPIIGINDSGGARIQAGVDSQAGYGEIFMRNALYSGVVPQLSVILGPCAGGAAYSPSLTDLVFVVEGISKMFVTGPNVIKAVLGEEISQEDLGGAKTLAEISGNAHFYATDEKKCFNQIRQLLSYLPQNNREEPQKTTAKEPTEPQRISSIIPSDHKRPYDVRDIIRCISDNSEFFEVHEMWAKNIVTGFGRIDGRSVGFVANQPLYLAGVLDCDASDKAARFIRFCDAFNIPVVSLTDVPGYMPGSDQEYKGIIRHGAKLLYAFAEATVPKINVIVRKAFGGAYIAMNSKHLGSDIVLAWPSAQIAVMGEAGAVEILYAKQIKAMPEEDRAAFIKDKQEEYRKNVVGYKFALDREYVDEVIKPKETREKLYDAMMDCRRIKNLKHVRPIRKHGNIPL